MRINLFSSLVLVAFVLSAFRIPVSSKTYTPLKSADTLKPLAGLWYEVADSLRPQTFFTEAWIVDDAKGVFAPLSFNRGYVSFETSGKGDKRLVFAITDLKKGVPVQIAAGQGVEVVATNPAQSAWKYAWKASTPYQIALTLLPDSAGSATIYAAYFLHPEAQRWKLLAAYRVPGYEQKLTGLGAFISQTKGGKVGAQRQLNLTNTWIQQGSRWRELTEANDMAVTGNTKKGIMIQDSTFNLWSGGKGWAIVPKPYIRPSVKNAPTIDYTRDADTVSRAAMDRHFIAQAVQEGKLDTTGSVAGVYYHILQEGTGAYVKVTDSVTVHYKGSLLSDGSIFDQTKATPATFPLGRLIKGWQLALPKSKVGGKVRVVIPSGQAYGIRTRSTAIPPNSILVFDIEVLKSW